MKYLPKYNTDIKPIHFLSLQNIICIIVAFFPLLGIYGCATQNSNKNNLYTTSLNQVYYRGIVAADHALGSQAGLEILQLGGNAIDAAVATVFCQAVVRPYSCGLGGGGFMLIHNNSNSKLKNPENYSNNNDNNIVLVYRETAPHAVIPSYYVDLNIEYASRYGPHASGVPGTVAGLLQALDLYGTLDRSVVLAPAIRIAESGFQIDDHYVQAVNSVLEKLAENPEIKTLIEKPRFDYLWQKFLFNGQPKIDLTLKQPELAATLRAIAKYGNSAFYTGPVAKSITQACPAINTRDLGRYTVYQTQPLSYNRFNKQFLTMPPPSSGGIAIMQILGFLEHHQEDILNHVQLNSPEYIHLVTEAMKHAFSDRALWLADTNFVDVPIIKLLDDNYINYLANQFNPDKTCEPARYGSQSTDIFNNESINTNLPEDSGTSHISVIDRWGNAVACTETINLEFGSLNTIPEYGIIMNNEMDDFVTTPGEANAFGLIQSDKNLPAPGKRPLSSMSPTIVLDEQGKVYLIAGASGGPRIITGTLQVILNTILFNMKPYEAVAQPRFHHQWLPDKIWFEKSWTDKAAIEVLKAIGHKIDERTDIGNVQLITRIKEGNQDDKPGYAAASDPRKGGQPAGW